MNKHNLKTKNSDWNWIYKIGGIAAIIAVLIFLIGYCYFYRGRRRY